MLKWTLNFRIEDKTTTEILFEKLHLATLSSTIRLHHLRCFDHTERTANWINKIQRMKVIGKVPKGRPPKS